VKTYQEVVEQFQTACNEHLAINSFAEGALDYLDASSQNIKYPYIFLRPLTSNGIVLDANGVSGTRTLTFEMYSLDIPKLSNASPLKIKSDTEQYIYDIISYFNLGDYQRTEFLTLQNITPVDEAFNDRAYGWVGVVNFNDSYTLNYCAYPKLP
tara:strand:- start:770 stop:1231 length:462 start_codon:yes stop_codon:yes gene_type:complete